MDRNF